MPEDNIIRRCTRSGAKMGQIKMPHRRLQSMHGNLPEATAKATTTMPEKMPETMWKKTIIIKQKNTWKAKDV